MSAMSDDGDHGGMVKGNGFALDEYLAARHGLPFAPKGGTMGKAVNPPGGILDKLVTKEQAPGPGFYFKEVFEKSFVNGARGGTFGKLVRDFGSRRKASDKSPAVGQYETSNSQVTPRTRGGLMSRNDRINIFAKMAERSSQWNSNGPGKYDAVQPDRNTPTPTFASTKTESRKPTKATSVGPGYYNPNYSHSEKRPPSYSGSKEDSGTFATKTDKLKTATPFPAYKDMPDSANHDRQGRKKHTKLLLKDRIVTPRSKARTPRSCEVASPNFTCIAVEMDTGTGT